MDQKRHLKRLGNFSNNSNTNYTIGFLSMQLLHHVQDESAKTLIKVIGRVRTFVPSQFAFDISLLPMNMYS